MNKDKDYKNIKCKNLVVIYLHAYYKMIVSSETVAVKLPSTGVIIPRIIDKNRTVFVSLKKFAENITMQKFRQSWIRKFDCYWGSDAYLFIIITWSSIMLLFVVSFGNTPDCFFYEFYS
jgi:hypothetical protein